MAIATQDTGLGTVLTAVPGSWTGSTISMDLHESTLPLVDTSHLGTTAFRTKMAGDLAEPGSVTLQVIFKGDVALPAAGDSGTLTITDPNTNTTGAIWGGTAIVTSVNHGPRAIDTLQTATITLEWDGETGPTFTAAT